MSDDSYPVMPESDAQPVESAVRNARNTFTELVEEHPLTAVAAAAAIGAGATALVIALASRREPTPAGVIQLGQSRAGEWYDSLQTQLHNLAAWIDHSVPTRRDLEKLAKDIGDGASNIAGNAANGVRQAVPTETAVNLTEKLLSHPVLTSLVMTALGGIAASQRQKAPKDPVPEQPEPPVAQNDAAAAPAKPVNPKAPPVH